MHALTLLGLKSYMCFLLLFGGEKSFDMTEILYTSTVNPSAD